MNNKKGWFKKVGKWTKRGAIIGVVVAICTYDIPQVLIFIGEGFVDTIPTLLLIGRVHILTVSWGGLGAIFGYTIDERG